MPPKGIVRGVSAGTLLPATLVGGRGLMFGVGTGRSGYRAACATCGSGNTVAYIDVPGKQHERALELIRLRREKIERRREQSQQRGLVVGKAPYRAPASIQTGEPCVLWIAVVVAAVCVVLKCVACYFGGRRSLAISWEHGVAKRERKRAGYPTTRRGEPSEPEENICYCLSCGKKSWRGPGHVPGDVTRSRGRTLIPGSKGPRAREQPSGRSRTRRTSSSVGVSILGRSPELLPRARTPGDPVRDSVGAVSNDLSSLRVGVRTLQYWCKMVEMELARACAGPGELSGGGIFRGAMKGDNALPSGELAGKLNRTVDGVFTVLQRSAKEAGDLLEHIQFLDDMLDVLTCTCATTEDNLGELEPQIRRRIASSTVHPCGASFCCAGGEGGVVVGRGRGCRSFRGGDGGGGEREEEGTQDNDKEEDGTQDNDKEEDKQDKQDTQGEQDRQERDKKEDKEGKDDEQAKGGGGGTEEEEEVEVEVEDEGEVEVEEVEVEVEDEGEVEVEEVVEEEERVGEEKGVEEEGDEEDEEEQDRGMDKDKNTDKDMGKDKSKDKDIDKDREGEEKERGGRGGEKKGRACKRCRRRRWRWREEREECGEVNQDMYQEHDERWWGGWKWWEQEEEDEEDEEDKEEQEEDDDSDDESCDLGDQHYKEASAAKCVQPAAPRFTFRATSVREAPDGVGRAGMRPNSAAGPPGLSAGVGESPGVTTPYPFKFDFSANLQRPGRQPLSFAFGAESAPSNNVDRGSVSAARLDEESAAGACENAQPAADGDGDVDPLLPALGKVPYFDGRRTVQGSW